VNKLEWGETFQVYVFSFPMYCYHSKSILRFVIPSWNWKKECRSLASDGCTIVISFLTPGMASKNAVRNEIKWAMSEYSSTELLTKLRQTSLQLFGFTAIVSMNKEFRIPSIISINIKTGSVLTKKIHSTFPDSS